LALNKIMREKYSVKSMKFINREKVKNLTGKRFWNRTQNFGSYIYKVLKQVHPDIKISDKAMFIMNGFVYEIFDRIAIGASIFASHNRKSIISSREIQSSVRLILKGHLSKHATSEGRKAVDKYLRLGR